MFDIYKKKIPGINNQIIFDKFPISIFKLLEKINIEFIKKNFNDQSQFLIGNYNFNLNSRVMSKEEKKLKLTEKEISSIVYLFNAARPVDIQELQSKVWGYQSELETNTRNSYLQVKKKNFKSFW